MHNLERVAVWLIQAHHWRMKAHSEDLRAKILDAVERGVPKSEAARAFGVSHSSVKRYAAARKEGRPLAPKKHPGPKPKLDESARKLLEADVEDRPAGHSQRHVPLLGRDGGGLFRTSRLPPIGSTAKTNALVRGSENGRPPFLETPV